MGAICGRFVSIFVTVWVCAAFVFSFAPKAFANPLYASYVLDYDTGAVLHESRARKKLHPASLTKVMTMLMVFEALQKGKIRMSDRMYVSRHAETMVPSKLGLKAGSSIHVRDAISALATKSANDVAVAVAEHLGGSERNFARMMTRRAHQLGMKRTRFMNASGLHHKQQVSTARDMAVMAQYVIQNYSQYYKFFGQESFSYKGVLYKNHNRLMKTYAGMDGMKTGYISASGFNLISSAVRDGRRIIGVVFGGKTSRSRNAHMASLLDKGFAKLPEVRLARASVPAPAMRPDRGDVLAQHEIAVASLEPASGVNGMVGGVIEQGSSDFAGGFDSAWAIQVGAFKSERKTKRALRKAVKQLPDYYRRAKPKVVPLKVAGAQLYRARLSGYSAHEAFAACAYIEDCITISP